MVDSPRTLAQLQADFADGGTAGNETPQKVRQIFLSFPMPNIIHQSFRPDMPPYNCVPDATPGVTGGTNNTTAIQAMMADIATRGWGEIILPEGLMAVQGGQIVAPTVAPIHMVGKGRALSGFQRINSASTGLLFDMSGATSGAPLADCELSNFQFNGLSSFNGGLLRTVYGMRHLVEDVQFWNTNDFAWQIVQLWDTICRDCNMIQCGMQTTATAFTTGDEGGGAGSGVPGSEVLQILGGIAPSGFGHTTLPSNQLRFIDLNIETFSAGAIVMGATSNFSGSSSNDVTFDKSKIETQTGFTGKYVIQQMNDVTYCKLLNTFVALGAASGANLAAMQGVYFSAGLGNKVTNLNFSLTASGALQSILKFWATGIGSSIEGVFHTGSQNPSNGILWQGGGTAPDWADVRSTNGATLWFPTTPGATSQTSPMYPTQDISSQTINSIVGAATPGTALSKGRRVINIITSVGGGAFVQLPAGTTVANQADEVTVINDTGSTLSIKPPTGGTVVGGATDAATTLAAHGRISFNSISASAWK